VPASSTTSIVLLAVALDMAFLAAAFAAGEAARPLTAARAAAFVLNPVAARAAVLNPKLVVSVTASLLNSPVAPFTSPPAPFKALAAGRTVR
jgi:hypothetical protein